MPCKGGTESDPQTLCGCQVDSIACLSRQGSEVEKENPRSKLGASCTGGELLVQERDSTSVNKRQSVQGRLLISAMGLPRNTDMWVRS